MSESINSKIIRASPEKVYNAFTDPAALEIWLVPGEMTGKVHHFDLRPGGGYEMSLYYPQNDNDSKGKTEDKEDRYSAKFIELSPERIIEAIHFNSSDPLFAGEMILEITLKKIPGGTNLTMKFRNIPPGIDPADNEAGTASSLEKLARYVEG